MVAEPGPAPPGGSTAVAVDPGGPAARPSLSAGGPPRGWPGRQRRIGWGWARLEQGQALVETALAFPLLVLAAYALVIGVIALVAIAGLTAFGNGITQVFTTIVGRVTGAVGGGR